MFLDAGPGNGSFPWWVFLMMPFMMLGMGLMMWLMMRMMMGMGSHGASHGASDAPKPEAGHGSEEEVASLKREVEALRRRLEAEPEVSASLPEQQQDDDANEHGSHGR